LIVSHRLAAVREADWIVVIEEGRIVEQGTHAELLRSGGHYAELWRRQSGGFIDSAPPAQAAE
jgi:ATP-binding cassette subfamily B multidrug efflux pump